MAHDLFQNKMAFVGETPWHGLGKRVAETITAAEMCRAAGLDWSVRKVPAPGARLMNIKTGRYDRYLVMRDALGSEQELVALGMVGAGYEPLQNKDAFSSFEPLIHNRFARFHTAGALGNGGKVWVLAKLDDQIKVDRDDVIDKFILLSNSHDGSCALSVRFTPIRVVCQNTLKIALENSNGVIAVRHTTNIRENLKKAQTEELECVIRNTFSDAATLFQRMAAREMHRDNMEAFLELVFPCTEKQKKERTQPERWGRVKTILGNNQVTPLRTRGTLWGLYNAIIRDEDYRVSREASAEARLERVWFGSRNDFKLRLLDLCRAELRKAA